MNRIVGMVAALSLSLVTSCADNGGGGSCSAESCATLPLPRCSDDGTQAITAIAFEGCDGGACRYIESVADCANGCTDGACSAPCAGISCAQPPAPECLANTLVAYAIPGTASGPGCTCSYEAVRTPCGDDVCFDGECRPFDCAFLSCDAPPDPRCEGTVLQQFGLGTCDEAARACVYAPLETDCAASGDVCRNGACVEGCRDEDCTSPPGAACDGSFALTFPATGACAGQACDYGEPIRTDCDAADATCVAGVCVPICLSETCISPPSPRCEDNVAVQPSETGRCDGRECVYDEVRFDCTAERLECVSGQCVTDTTCEGVVCSRPPEDSCDGDIAVQHSAAGYCTTGGVCSYPETRRDCAAAGSICSGGACADFCDVAVCVDPPADFCDGQTAVIHPGFGACDEGARDCVYTPFRVNCAALGQSCIAGACVGSCVAEDCDTPPEDPFCIGDELALYEPLGFCRADQSCGYNPEIVRDCADTGEVCFEGRCIAYCGGVLCNTPPDSTCTGDVLVAHEPVGVCVSGTCTYVEARTNCRAEGLGCVDGACVDLCETLSCSERPPDYCDDDVLVISTFPVTCEASTCVFEQTRFDCRATGDVCEAGACVDPCVGVVCDDPGPNGCDGDQTVRYRPVGTCAGGTCTYRADRFDCASVGASCVAATCVDLCVGVECDDVPADGCYDTRLLDYSGEAVCVGGDCFYFTASAVDCAEFGFLCAADMCVDPCGSVDCVTPEPPTCADDELLIEYGPGTCSEGLCSYDQDVLDCQAFGTVCSSGSCVDSCASVPCGASPDPRCEDNVLVEYTASAPVCVGSTCLWEEIRTDCLATGRACAAGACAAVADVCASVTCPATSGPICDGDAVVERAAPGTCVAGPPTRCSYGVLESRTACGEDFGCVSGQCVRVPQPGELVITEIAVNPAGSDLGAEWFEVVNASPDPLELAGIRVSSALGGFTIDASLVAGVGAHVVFASSADAVSAPDFTYPYFLLPLRNDADTVEMSRGTELIDAVDFDLAAGWTVASGAVLSLDPSMADAASNDGPAAWCSRPVPGSPGIANPACP